MAKHIKVNVNSTFNISTFSKQLAYIYHTKGYSVKITHINRKYIIVFEKDTNKINTLLGLGEGIRAICTIKNDTLYIDFEYIYPFEKLSTFVLGLFLFLIPTVTSIVGCSIQASLTKSIANDAISIASSRYM